jgi:hypothetical protein
MKRSKQWIVLAVLLLVVSVATVVYKVRELGFPLMPEMTSQVWSVQARMELHRRGGPVKAVLELPIEPSGFAINRENFVSRGFGLALTEDRAGRHAEWAIRRLPQDRTLYYRAQVSRGDERTVIEGRPRYPEIPQLEEPFASALQDIVDEVRAASADTASFASAMLTKLNADSTDENISLFQSNIRGSQEKVELVQTLLAGAHIPTRQVHGFTLSGETDRAEFETLLGVYNDQEWLIYDPRTGNPGLPRDFFVWWVGDRSIARATGAHLEDLQVSTQVREISSLELAEQRSSERESLATMFTVLELPIQTQSVYEVLLLVPFGILVIVILRNVVGLSSFGTFAPVLIALAFRETELLRGLCLFVLIVTLGLAFRFYLERLRLLLIPRLGAVVTIVVLLMGLISVVGHRLDMDTGLSVSLFPMIIISMVIERMSVVWEERGAWTSIREGIGSLAMAALAYAMMSNELLSYWVRVFPEINLAILAMIIALGRYTGFRLNELIRFRQLDPKQAG